MEAKLDELSEAFVKLEFRGTESFAQIPGSNPLFFLDTARHSFPEASQRLPEAPEAPRQRRALPGAHRSPQRPPEARGPGAPQAHGNNRWRPWKHSGPVGISPCPPRARESPETLDFVLFS